MLIQIDCYPAQTKAGLLLPKAPEDNIYPGDQLHHLKGFYNIIFRPQRQSLHTSQPYPASCKFRRISSRIFLSSSTTRIRSITPFSPILIRQYQTMYYHYMTDRLQKGNETDRLFIHICFHKLDHFFCLAALRTGKSAIYNAKDFKLLLSAEHFRHGGCPEKRIFKRLSIP